MSRLSPTTTVLLILLGQMNGDFRVQSKLIFSSVADVDGKANLILLKVSNFFNNPDTYRDNKIISSVQ